MNKKDPFVNAPENTPIYLISDHHRIYLGTIVRRDGEWFRGDCLMGDPDSFYRDAIVNWAYLEEKDA